MMQFRVAIIGGGLAGTEAAYQLARRNISVTLYEMRPNVKTGIHETPYMGELVCSNSLGSQELTSASGLLKKELTDLDSFFLKTVLPYRVPSGLSLSIDRIEAAKAIDKAISSCGNITVVRQEISSLPEHFDALIIASGPLTSPELAQSLQKITKRRYLYFYDATSPIIRYHSIDQNKIFRASRYDKGEPDFLNISLDENQYHTFLEALLSAKCVPLQEIDAPIFYSSCLPIEEIARRGPMSLAFGPLKPVGLIDPRTGKQPFAVIQLRQEDLHHNLYQMVGFQTRLLYPEQKRIFSQLPALENASFERFGRMHRNSYINAPLIIDEFFRCKNDKNLYFCGQISGVEGYLESIASGYVAGVSLFRQLNNLPLVPLPRETAIGSLAYTISHSNWKNFCPTNFTFGLLESDFTTRHTKKERKGMKSERALNSLNRWIQQNIC